MLYYSSVAVDNYRIFRNDRLTRGEGVMFSIKRGINAKIICESTSSTVEYLFLELHIGDLPLLVVVVYNSRSSNDLTPLISILSVRYDDIIIMGDTNLLNFQTKVAFQNEISSLALDIVPTE